MSTDYYKKVHDRFGRQPNSTSDKENDKPKSKNSKHSAKKESESVVNSSSFKMLPPPDWLINHKKVNMSTNKKREIKSKLKDIRAR